MRDMLRRCLLAIAGIAAASSLAFAEQDGRGGDRRWTYDDWRIGVQITDPVVRTHYDGQADDLLTAGLGKAGMQGAAPPMSGTPTPPELRRLAIYTNYRALVDVTEGGGYGLFWGPNVRADGTVTSDPGLIPGDETLAFALQSDGSRITLMVQVPDGFDPARACIVAAPSSGSRGIYGAIATAGEWGLKHGCAVAYTDKGTGTGFDDLQNRLVTTLRGEATPIAEAGAGSQLTTPLSEAQRDAFNAASPNRFAFKHAHSRVNPEADWGQHVLQSIRFAFQVLGEKFPSKIDRRHTIVIASSVSNGGGASIRAAEADRGRLIDGVAVAEPNVNPVYGRFAIQQGSNPPFTRHGRPLIDYVTLQNVFVGCAIAGQDWPLNVYPSPDRCASLKQAGLLSGATTAEQAAEAQAILNDYGILPEQNKLQAAMWALYVPQSIAMTYANAYGRFSVTDALCGYSFAATDAEGVPIPLATAAENALFGIGNGIPPTGGVNLINNAVGKESRLSTPDQNLQGALCLRSLATGRDAVTGRRLDPIEARQADRIEGGAQQILADGDLHGTPTLIVTGRADDILPPNFTSRAYVGLNQLREGERSRVSYVEVTNAQHLDALLGVPGIKENYLPLHRYFVQAMDLMYAHLRSGAALPPSQVVRTVPRGASVITTTNVPPIVADPGANAITFRGRVLAIPD